MKMPCGRKSCLFIQKSFSGNGNVTFEKPILTDVSTITEINLMIVIWETETVTLRRIIRKNNLYFLKGFGDRTISEKERLFLEKNTFCRVFCGQAMLL